MVDERVDAEIRSRRGDPKDIATRVDGIENEEIRAAVGRRVAEVLTRPRGVPSGAATSGTVEQQAGGESVRVGLDGFTADRQRERELRAAVRASVIDELAAGPEASAAGAALAQPCVCASDVPGDRIDLSHLSFWWDENGAWIPPPDGSNDYVIAMWIDNWNVLQLKVFNGATSDPPVPKNQVDVGLKAVTDWPKEIWANNLCFGRASAVFHPGNSQTAMNRLRLDEPVCWEGIDTIVFRKPGFWGVWHDIAHLAPQQFWRVFGGTKINFIWITD